jgi:integrase
MRTGSNPAIWRGNLKLLLPRTSRVHTVEHHAPLDWREAPDFLRQLRMREGVGPRALEFLIHTAARSGEVRTAQWNDINLDEAEWIIPAQRMKGGKEHPCQYGGTFERAL